MSGALRLLFASLGFEVDESGLKKADAMARDLAARITSAWEATGAGGDGAKAALAGLASVQRDIAAGFDELAHAAEAALPSLMIDDDLYASAKTAEEAEKRKRDAIKKTAEEAEKRKRDAIKKTAEEAESARKKREADNRADAFALAQRRAAPFESALREREDHGFKKAFDQSDEGKAHAAWKRTQAAEEAAKKPVEGWTGLIEKAYSVASTKIGQQLPQGFQRLAARMGVARGDFVALGRLALGVGATLAALAAGAVHSSVALAAQAEQLRDTARESRLTTTELQELRHAGAVSGVGADRMAAGVANLAQNLRSAEMRLGGNGIGGQLRRLGVDLRDGNGQVRATGDIIDDLAVAFERVPSPIRRARIATQLFGESGRRMLDVLHTGPGGLRALREELEQLGGGVTPEATAAAREFTQAQERLGRASDSLRSVIAVGVLPVLTWMTTKAAELGGLFARLTRGTHLVEIAMGALGVAAAAVALATIGAWGPVVAPFVAAAAAIAAVGLVIDDVWTFIEGGDSALGRFIDSMVGAGTSAQFARALREEWDLLVGSVERAIAAVAEFFNLNEQPAIGRVRPAGASRQGRPAADTRTDAQRASDRAAYLDFTRRQNAARTQRRAAPAAAVLAAAAATVTVPAQHVVPAGVSGTRTTTVNRNVTVAPGAVVVHGATDPEAVGRVVRRELAAANAQTDGDHALAADDGGA